MHGSFVFSGSLRQYFSLYMHGSFVFSGSLRQYLGLYPAEYLCVAEQTIVRYMHVLLIYILFNLLFYCFSASYSSKQVCLWFSTDISPAVTPT